MCVFLRAHVCTQAIGAVFALSAVPAPDLRGQTCIRSAYVCSAPTGKTPSASPVAGPGRTELQQPQLFGCQSWRDTPPSHTRLPAGDLL